MAGRIIRIIAVASALLVATGIAVEPAAAQSARPGLMQLNVRNASVQEVLKLIAEEGDFNIAIGDGVKGSVTLYMDDIPPRDLLDIVVGLVGAAYVEENDAIWVMSNEAYEGRYGENFSDRLQSRSFTLTEANARDVLPSIRDLLGNKGTVKLDPDLNVIRIKAGPRLLREAGELIRGVDQARETRSFQLQNIPVGMATVYLSKLLGGNTPYVEDPVNQRLLVSAPEYDLDRFGRILRLVDVGSSVESAMLPVRYAHPDSLAQKLRPHLTPEFGEIYSDADARKLVIMDFPPVIEKISSLVDEFDVAVRQVLIEAKIIQVSTSRETRTGIDWSGVEKQVNLSGRFPILADTEPGLRGKYGDLASRDLEIIVQALETYGETDLLSSPRLVVADGGKGHIHVGSQVPYKTIDTRETATGTLNQFEQVVVVDVGVKLEVEAFIKGEDMVSLIVRPEVSSVSGYSDDIPIIEASTVESTLMVQDGNTVILGGLIRDETRKVRNGIPVLGRLPILKYLFSSTSDEKYKAEMIILLTPTIMSGREPYEHRSYLEDD